MKIIKPSSAYGAHWGLTDLYDEDAKNLREAVESGEDFVFEYGCKKEIRRAEIKRVNGELTVWCESELDELGSITDTIMWEAMGGNAYAGSGYSAVAKYHDLDPNKDEDKVMQIMEECEGWFEDIYEECHEHTVDLGICLDYDQVVAAIDDAENEAEAAAQKCYGDMIECAKESISAIAEQANMHRYV